MLFAKMIAIALVIAGVGTAAQGLQTGAEGENAYTQSRAMIPTAIAYSARQNYR
ncbi:hypothetical protein [Synechococcus sp. PCC 7336]|uniref:hypothetical protein n=1 Tax=Synechococcus sp. PCC 7336 TaxID=195250 RepID=UPI00034CB397|nr:hypothetical protein [Synechococcus sp. PCC 7336]